MFDAIVSAFSGIANAIGSAYLAALFIGAILVALLIEIVIVRLSYETKLLKAIDGFNAYLRAKPYVGDDNLIEFNNHMKAAPGILRNRWQMFVLNREDGIAKYINLDSCVEKPLRTSIIDRIIKNFVAVAVLLAFLSAVLGAAIMAGSPALNFGQILLRVLAVPAVIALVAVIGVVVLRSLKGAVQSDLYEYFHIFEQNIARAVTTLPPYIDYEILFTHKEIRDSIPVLQQYLEKRAITEQEELEKARKSAIEVEKYNFDELGLNGALVLERAMRECEVYLGTKRRLRVECDNIETERDNYAKNYDMTSKEYQRKLQASRENLERLKGQQESSTNRIESNYIKKQQADEIKKQQQIEKDADVAALKFKEEQEALRAEISKRQEEIEAHRIQIEDAMKFEFKNYARLMFSKLQEIAVQKMGSDYSRLTDENDKLRGIIKRAKGGGGVELETVAEELEEEERERDVLEGKKIPEFVSKGFDLAAETNFDPPAQKPEQTETETEEKIEPIVFDEPEKETLKISDDRQSETLEPVRKTNKDLGNSLSEEAFKTPEFKFDEDDFKPDIKFVDEGDFDGGRKMDTDTASETGKKPVTSEQDDMLIVNQKLQEENQRLREQKEALDNEINATISRIEEKPQKAPKGESIDDVQFMLDSMKENLKKQSESSVKAAPKPAAKPAPSRQTAANAEKPAGAARRTARPVRAGSESKRTEVRTSVAPKAPAARQAPRRRSMQTDEVHSVDDLAGEMDRLINSNKKK